MSAMPPIATKVARGSEMSRCVRSCREQMQQMKLAIVRLFHHLVGAQQERFRDREAERALAVVRLIMRSNLVGLGSLVDSFDVLRAAENTISLPLPFD
jgi:hypothetical protein